jgi:two-component system sensor histidine kinase UhpB
MTNVQRHAGATTVALRAGIEGGRLRITIEDDGCGIGADGGNADGPSWGILGMQERSRSLGGDLTLAPRPGGGTIVTLGVPVGEHDVV